MIKLRNMLIAAIAIVAYSTTVFAGNFSVGVVGSMLEVDASGTETDTLTAGGAAVADTSVRNKSISDKTFTGSVYGEFTSETTWPITFGVEYTPGRAELGGKFSRTDTATSETGNPISTAVKTVRNAEADATNFGSIYIEAPIWGMLYGRVGHSQMDINYDYFQTGPGNSGSYTERFQQLSGLNLGIGLKSTTDGGMNWKLSYEETDYDAFSTRSQGNSVTANSNLITADLDTSAVRFSLGKNF